MERAEGQGQRGSWQGEGHERDGRTIHGDRGDRGDRRASTASDPVPGGALSSRAGRGNSRGTTVLYLSDVRAEGRPGVSSLACAVGLVPMLVVSPSRSPRRRGRSSAVTGGWTRPWGRSVVGGRWYSGAREQRRCQRHWAVNAPTSLAGWPLGG
jgi:hypothetical protein